MLSFIKQNCDTLSPLITKWLSINDEEELSELAASSNFTLELKVRVRTTGTILKSESEEKALPRLS